MHISLELLLGLTGTLTGGLSLILQWRQWCADQAVIRIIGSISIRRSIQLSDDHLSLKIVVQNHGRRHVQIREVGFLMAENEWHDRGGRSDFLRESRLKAAFLQPCEFILQEGGRQEFEVYPFGMEYLEQMRTREKRVLIFYAFDTLDREHRAEIWIPSEDVLNRIGK